MKKHIKRTIKNIEFNQTAACLELVSPGKNIFGLSLFIAIPIILAGLAFWFVIGVPPAGLLFIALGIFLGLLGYLRPKYEWIDIDQNSLTLIYNTARFAGLRTKSKPKIQLFLLKDIAIDWEIRYQDDLVISRIRTVHRNFLLACPQQDHEELFDWYSSWAVAAGLDLPSDDPDQAMSPQADNPGSTIVYEHKDKNAVGHAAMLQEITSWGRSSLVLGLIHIVASGFLNPGWGVTLLVVGGLSFLVQEASMFILYAVSLVWVGVSNMLSSELGLWTFFGFYQIYLGLRLFGKYKRYRDYERRHIDSLADVPSGSKVGRAERFFPWAGSGLSLLGLIVYGGTWVFLIISLMITYAENQTTQLSEMLYTVLELIGGVALGLGMVGFALSLAAVVSKYSPKWLAWVGLVLGSILVLIEIALNVWFLFGG